MVPHQYSRGGHAAGFELIRIPLKPMVGGVYSVTSFLTFNEQSE